MDATDPLGNGVWETQTLDVGQADARLNITEEGELILIDADTDDVAEALDEVLDGRTTTWDGDDSIPVHLVVTHLHDDHVRGIETLYDNGYEMQTAIQPDNNRFQIRDPETGEPEDGIAKDVRNEYVKNLEKHGIDNISQVSVGDTIPIDSDTDINVLAPPDTEDSVDVTRAATGADVNFKPINANENGAVFKIEGERSALFMGDVQNDAHHYAESWLIQQHDNPENDIDLDADVLFVGHHGSGNATSEEFLNRVEPETAVISSELNGQYDHPHDNVLKNLHEHDVDVSWTAGHGTTRTDLDEHLTTTHTKDLEMTNAADLAALKHYCGDNETAAADVTLLAADDLPTETPEWVAESAPMVAETTQEMVDTAIAKGENVQDVRQALDNHPAATEHLRETVEIDRDETAQPPEEESAAVLKERIQELEEAHEEQSGDLADREETIEDLEEANGDLKAEKKELLADKRDLIDDKRELVDETHELTNDILELQQKLQRLQATTPQQDTERESDAATDPTPESGGVNDSARLGATGGGGTEADESDQAEASANTDSESLSKAQRWVRNPDADKPNPIPEQYEQLFGEPLSEEARNGGTENTGPDRENERETDLSHDNDQEMGL
jgi:competence protein ComEC